MNASLESAYYIVQEEDGLIEACAILEGFIDRNVTLQISTLDNSANGTILS